MITAFLPTRRPFSSPSGSVNWHALLPVSAPSEFQAYELQEDDGSSIQISVQSLQLSNSIIAFWDDLNNRRLRLLNLDLDLSSPPLSDAIQVKLNSEMMLWPDNAAESRVNAHAALSSQFRWDREEQAVEGSDTRLNLRLAGPAFASQQLESAIAMHSFQWDRDDDTLQADEVQVRMLGAKLQTEQLNVKDLSGKPDISGHVQATGIDVPQWLHLWELERPEAIPSGALNDLALSGDFRFHLHGLHVSGLDAQLNDTRIRGDLSLLKLDYPHLSANLHLNQLPLSTYWAVSRKDESQEDASGDSVAETLPFVGLPIDWLREQNLDIRLEIGHLSWKDIAIEQPRLKLVAEAGRWDLKELIGKLNGGSFVADAQLDVSGGIPEYQLNLDLSQLELGGLLTHFINPDAAPIEGTTDLEMSLNARGLKTQTFLPSLSGFVGLTVRNGSLQIGEVASAVEGAVAALQNRPRQTTTKGRLLFDQLSASWHANDGRLLNHDLNLDAGAVNVTGRGHVDLPAELLEYQLSVGSEDSPRVPVRISGPFDDLSHSLDLSALAKTKIEEEVESLKKKTQEEIEEKVQEKLSEEMGEKTGEAVQKILNRLF